MAVSVRALRFAVRGMESVLSCLVAAAIAITTSPCPAAAPVEGPRDLLDLLISAQAGNEGLFPEGTLTANVSVRWNTLRGGIRSVRSEDARASIVWQGERTYCDYSLHGKDSDHDRALSQNARLIDDGKSVIWYSPDVRLLQRVSDGSRRHPDYLDLRPDQMWYRFERDSRPWREMLDPEAPWAASVARFVVNRVNEDRIVVERHLKNGTGLRIQASLEVGGNIIGYESLHDRASQGRWRTGSYRWEPHRDGRWFLREFQHSNFTRSGSDEAESHYTLHILTFDPDPTIRSDRFALTSLQAAPGTLVEEVHGAKTTRTYRMGAGGREEPKLPGRQLDELAERMRTRGFAAPSRASP